MKLKFKHTMMTFAAVALLAATVGCKKDKVSDDDAAMAEIAEQYVKSTVIPTYTNLASFTEQLAIDLQTLKNNKTQENLENACQSFLTAREWWEKSEAFL